jgi:hypothetical protein
MVIFVEMHWKEGCSGEGLLHAARPRLITARSDKGMNFISPQVGTTMA